MYRCAVYFFATAGLAITAVDAHGQSSVTLYGIVDDGLTYVSNQKGHSNIYFRQGNNAGSRWGFLGVEDLGGGLKAVFNVEDGFDPNSGATTASNLLFGRQAYVGLKTESDATITLGRQYPITFLQLLRQTPTYWYSAAAGAAPGGIDGLDSTQRINNSVVFTSPTWGGLRVSAQYGFGGMAGKAGAGSTVAVVAEYVDGGIAFGSGYVRMANTGNTPGSFDTTATATFLGSAVNQGYLSAHLVQQFVNAGTYQFHDFTVGANFANVVYRPDGNSLFHDTAVFNIYGLLAAYSFTSSISVAGGASIAYGSKANAIQDPAKYYQYSLRESYSLSKRTTLYALQGYQRASGNTLGAGKTGIVPALPVIGDSQTLTPSSTSTQFLGIIGITTSF